MISISTLCPLRLAGVLWYLLLFAAAAATAAEAEPEPALVEMVIQLVKDPDRDMYGLGLQQVREELPGAAVTQRLVELLDELPPERRAGLIEALGERGDPAARPAIVQRIQSGKEEVVRAAALRALGHLGDASHVMLLVDKAAAGSAAEKAAANQSLLRLKGDEVDQAMVAALEKADSERRVVLLSALAGRNAKQALPAVLRSVGDSNPAVRQAALDALRYLADESHVGQVAEILKQMQSPADRTKAEMALLTLCSRGGAACAAAIIQAMEGAEPAARVALLHALARAGGAEALQAVIAHLEDKDPAVRDEAVRMLAIWPDAAAAEPLRKLAANRDNLRYHVLALRGLVRLASPTSDRPADLKTLAEVLQLAQRPDEKRLVLGALGGVPAAEALALVEPLIGQQGVADEAALAAVLIAEKIHKDHPDKVRKALEKVVASGADREIVQRARKLLDRLP